MQNPQTRTFLADLFIVYALDEIGQLQVVLVRRIRLDIDSEHPLEALGPGHRPLPVADRDFGAFSRSGLVDCAERVRELRVGPDGAMYALTNEEGDAPRGTAALFRISPAGD